MDGKIFHPANEVEGVATVLAFTETIPDVLFEIDAELCFVGAFMDRARAGQGMATAFEGIEQSVLCQHLLHGDPGTDVPEIDERFLFLGHEYLSF